MVFIYWRALFWLAFPEAITIWRATHQVEKLESGVFASSTMICVQYEPGKVFAACRVDNPDIVTPFCIIFCHLVKVHISAVGSVVEAGGFRQTS